MVETEDFEELEFVIPAYRPETMPLDRLLEYLEQIAALVGAPQDMHLVRIEPSSTKPVFKMPVPAAVRAREQTLNVRAGRGTNRQRDAYETVRKMVRLDGGKPATLKDRTGVLIDFQPEVLVPFLNLRQPTTYEGALLRIGGAGEYSAILMQGTDGETAAGFSAPKSLAKAMALLLFEPIRLAGIGNWERSSNGDWKLSKMLVQSFEALHDRPLADVVDDLRRVPVTWPSGADELLEAERQGAL